MPADLAVLVVHGIGCQAAGFARPTIEGLAHRLDRRGLDPGRVHWQTAWWAPVLDVREEELLRRVDPGGTLGWRKLRRFVVSAFGDAIAYQRVPGAGTQVYRAVHEILHEAILRIRDATSRDDVPLVVLAHSLGCEISSNYIWDAQRGRRHDGAPFSDETPIERMDTLCGFVTFGCNIPLFTLRLPRYEPIEFPGRRLPPRLRDAARWLNLYDPDDALGYPLAPLCPAAADVAVDVGGLLSSWNPLSHAAYWDDAAFLDPVAGLLAALLAAA